MLKSKFFFSVLILCLSCLSFAKEAVPTKPPVQNPVAELNSAAKATVEQISDLRVRLKVAEGDLLPFPPVEKIINSTLVPLVDLLTLSRQTIGPTFDKATPEEQARFMDSYKKLLINTYGAALLRYKNQQIQFFKVREDYQTVKQIKVRGQLVFPNADPDNKKATRPPIQLVYTLLLDTKANQWKVIDLSVEGVSLSENFRAQFAELQKDKAGIAHLTQVIDDHNKQVAEALKHAQVPAKIDTTLQK